MYQQTAIFDGHIDIQVNIPVHLKMLSEAKTLDQNKLSQRSITSAFNEAEGSAMPPVGRYTMSKALLLKEVWWDMSGAQWVVFEWRIRAGIGLALEFQHRSQWRLLIKSSLIIHILALVHFFPMVMEHTPFKYEVSLCFVFDWMLSSQLCSYVGLLFGFMSIHHLSFQL